LTVTCALPFLGSNNVAPLITLQLTAPITSGVIVNTARVAYDRTDPQPTNNIATATTTISTSIDLDLQNLDLVDPVGAGRPITYSLVVHNNGSVPANPITIADALPANTTFISYASADGSWGCALSAGTLNCTRNLPATPLLVGSTAATITVVLLAPYPSSVPPSGFITAQASASSQLSDPFPLNNTNVVATTTVTTNADLAMFKFGTSAADSDSVYPYTLHVTNNGPSVATNVQVVDNVPAAIQSVTAGAGWTCTTSGATVTCTYAGTLDVNATTSDIVILVKAPQTNVVLTNSAVASSGQPDPQPVNNTAQVATTISNCHHGVVDPAHSLISAAPTDVYADNTATARIIVTLRDACDIVLLNPPYDPQSVTLTSSRPSVDTVTLAGGYSNPTNTGQVAFDVKSTTAGGSTYSAVAQNVNTSATVNVAATAHVNYYACVDLSLPPLAGGGQQFVQFKANNSSGLTRHLTGVTLTWPQSGGRKVQSLTLGATSLWSGHSNNNPFQIPSTGLSWIAGTDPARTLANGSGSQTLQFNLSYGVVRGEVYQLTTTWDDGAGGRTCTKSISLTIP
jgi:uncharacterized repeat protein (TIGR01451 family)